MMAATATRTLKLSLHHISNNVYTCIYDDFVHMHIQGRCVHIFCNYGATVDGVEQPIQNAGKTTILLL